MIGSFINRFLILVLGYVYPAYKCYKAVQLNESEIEQLRFWCQYWILVALLAIVERFGDIFFSWLPLYCEAKLGFYLYLWYPNTRGATYIYDTYFGPYIAKHETEIDRNLLEMRARAADVVQLSLQTAANYFQTRLSEVLKFAIVMVQTPKLHSFETPPLLQTQQPQEQQQAPLQLSSSPARQPATSREPREETSAPADTTKILPQEQLKMAASSLQPPAFPVQTRELVPETETDGSETANDGVSKSEKPTQIETTNSQVAQDSNPQLLESIEEATDVPANSSRKQVAASAVYPL